MHPLVDIFTKRVETYMEAAPVVVTAEETISELIQRLTASKCSTGLVVTQERRLVGIVTSQDLMASISQRLEVDVAVSEIMTSPVRSVGPDDYLYHALRHMRRFGLHRLPVVDASHRPIGLVSFAGLMSGALKTVMDYARYGSDQDEISSLKRIKDTQADFADQLLSDGVTATDAQVILSEINRYIHKQVLDYALIGVVEDGWGRLPVSFAAVIMGSGGRHESLLNPDQDNGFILADYPQEKHGAIDPFFIEVAERFTTHLDRIGIPFCRGYIMATNPAWRKTSTEWRLQLSYWKRHPSLTIARQADIFFDFESFFGEESLSLELRRYVSEFAKTSPGFLRAMHSDESSQLGVALSLFGRLRSQKDDPEHEGQTNLKYGALVPLTQSVRLLALREGIDATSTLDRINRLTELGKISAKENRSLTHALSALAEILLRQQILDHRDGRGPSYFVAAHRLSQWQREEVVLSLKSIAGFRARVDEELTGRT